MGHYRVAMLHGDKEGAYTHCGSLRACLEFIEERMGDYYDGARITLVAA